MEENKYKKKKWREKEKQCVLENQSMNNFTKKKEENPKKRQKKGKSEDNTFY